MKKLKSLTFSYDDGVTQDIRLIELFDKYGMKATFNINSELLGRPGEIKGGNGETTSHTKVAPDKVKEIYKNHEVAVHTLTHPNLTTLDEDEIIRQVNGDRENLSKLCGYDIIGMAYPCGGINNDDRVAKIIQKNTPIKYSRTITSNYSFEPQKNLLRFNPTVYHLETDKMFELADEFIALKPETPNIFYIWGHSYEFDLYGLWDKFEELLKKLSGHDDIYYGTNRDVLL